MKGRATAGFGSIAPIQPVAVGGKSQGLAGQVVDMIAAAGGPGMEADEEEEKDDYFSDE